MFEGEEVSMELWRSGEFQEVVSDLFRGRGNVLKRGSPEELEFEAFLQKYLARREQQQLDTQQERNPTTAAQTNSEPSATDLPQRFDAHYAINMAIVQPEQRRDERPSKFLRFFNHPVIRDLRNILQLFMDYRAKAGLEKIQKLQSDRANLPIAANQQQIIDMVSSNQVTLIAGDTGCGKSTQVVQYLLNSGFTNIVCTQPRRISAMSLCRRVAFETLNEYGSEIAYQIRFETSRSHRTRVLFMTEGVLLRQMMQTAELPDYNVVIVDEVHERHVTCDFLLGLLKGLLDRRRDLKLVLMSATINAELFSSYFGNAPMIRVPGRLYPVEVRYVPTKKDMSQSALEKLRSVRDQEESDPSSKQELSRLRMEHRLNRESFDPSEYVRLLQKLDEQYEPQERGDLLMFLSGMAEMQAVFEAAKPYVERTKRWIVLMLHSSLSMEDQDKAFQAAPTGVRKCILSTNIAETSVTIDGIRFVADSGKAKELMWDPKTGTKSLQEFWISKASAQQRKGRAGRTGPGICFRFYSEKTFNTLVGFAEPEIVRTPLEGIILQLKVMGWTDPREFQFITPPPIQHLTAAATALAILGATIPSPRLLTRTSQSSLRIADLLHQAPLTPLGHFLAGIPVEPNVGKIIALGAAFDLAETVATLAATMSARSPFEQTPTRVDLSAEEQYRLHRFDSEDGDAFTVVAAFQEWTVQKSKHRHTRGWCRKYQIKEQRLYELTMVRQQLLSALGNATAPSARGSRLDLDSLVQSNDVGSPHRRPSKRHLQRLKLEQSRKRSKRVLSLGDAVGEFDLQSDAADLAGEEPADGELDLHDMEFRMRSDVRHLAQEATMPRTARDQWTIKLILCAGLYPQFAIADPANLARPQADYQFSTMLSDGLVIHPSSVCARHNLDASASSSQSAPHSRYLFDDRAALYVYGNLLQTKKSMLCNIFRMPALQTCLLFARKIYTSLDLLEILVDDWLLFELSSSTVAEQLLVQCCRLRSEMATLLSSAIPPATAPTQSLEPDDSSKLRLEALLQHQHHPFEKLAFTCFKAAAGNGVGNTSTLSPSELSRELAEFMIADVGDYSMKKVQEHAIRSFFQLGQDESIASQDADNREESLFAEMVQTAQGIQATAYLQLGGLRNKAARAEFLASSESLRYRWDCPSCKKSIMVTTAEMEAHIGACCEQRANDSVLKRSSEPKKRAKLGTSVR